MVRFASWNAVGIDAVKQVLGVLRGLETLAGKLNKIVVVFIDEFQRILETERADCRKFSY